LHELQLHADVIRQAGILRFIFEPGGLDNFLYLGGRFSPELAALSALFFVMNGFIGRDVFAGP
jgi:hypothetical protein